MLQDLKLDLVTPEEIHLNLDVKEDGKTYKENAAKKAVSFAQASGLVSLADDTGLEVEALGGAPGLYSARYAPQPDATDADRRTHLLAQLQSHPQPWIALFRCIVAIATPDGDLKFAEGICPALGLIIIGTVGTVEDTIGKGHEPVDPIFVVGYCPSLADEFFIEPHLRLFVTTIPTLEHG